MSDLKDLKKKSIQGALLSGFGFVVVICSFIYGAQKLKTINVQVEEKNVLLDSLSYSVNKMKGTLANSSEQIVELERVISGLDIGKNHIEKGVEYYYSGDFKNAIVQYDSAISNHAKNASAYGLKGQSQIIIRHYSEAEKNLLKSIELNSERPQPYYSLILLSVKRDDIANAFVYLDKLLAISPHYLNQIKFVPELNILVLNESFVSIQQKQKQKLKFVQEKLNELNYYDGESDGFFGAKTSAAIVKYQEDKNLKKTGTWDLVTLNELGYE